jgi:hypothetical protein
MKVSTDSAPYFLGQKKTSAERLSVLTLWTDPAQFRTGKQTVFSGSSHKNVSHGRRLKVLA